MDWREGRGVRIGKESYDFVPESSRLKPLRDTVIVEVLDWQPSQYVRVAYSGKPLRGVIRAVGPGTYPWIYTYEYIFTRDGPQRQKNKRRQSRSFVPTTVRPGDVIELGGLELGGYLFGSFRWGLKECVMCQEADIAGVVDGQ